MVQAGPTYVDVPEPKRSTRRRMLGAAVAAVAAAAVPARPKKPSKKERLEAEIRRFIAEAAARPRPKIDRDTLLIADLFCGAGGSTTGAIRALRERGKKPVITCVNHWPVAIATHAKNHPEAFHYIEDVHSADPEKLVPEGYLDLLMASPECRGFSRARGGKPTSDQMRMSCWAINRWLGALQVRVLLVENVKEFVDYGPICTLRDGHKGPHREAPRPAPAKTRCNRPIKEKKGLYFQAWINSLAAMGYRFQWRFLNAAHFGAATTRERFFLIARKDSKPIRWPEPTHVRPAELAQPTLFETRRPWKVGRDVIDFTIPTRSIFDDPKYLKEPLSPNTIKRIGRGIEMFVKDAPAAYLELLGLEPTGKTSRGGAGKRIDGGERDGQQPFIVVARENNVPRGVSVPLPAITTQPAIALVEAQERPVAQFVGGNRAHNVPCDLGQPVPTITTANGGGIYAAEAVETPAFVLGQHGGGVARSVDQPLPTITGDGFVRVVEAVAEPATKIVTSYYGSSGAGSDVRSVDQPLSTITTKPRHGLAEVGAYPAKAAMVLSKHGDFGGSGGVPARSVDEPLFTITGESAPNLVETVEEPAAFVLGRHIRGTVRSLDEPLPTATGNGVGAIVETVERPAREAVLIPYRGEREGQAPRCHSVDEPLPAITAGGKGCALVETWVMEVAHTGDPGPRARALSEPLTPITTKRQHAIVEVGAELAAEQELAAVRAWLRERGKDPRRAFIRADGVVCIRDIRYRMLVNPELARATAFTSEEYEYEFVGGTGDVTRQIGNAVPPDMAAALVGVCVE